MWNPNVGRSEVKKDENIPPVLKNFNVFDVLEPIKVHKEEKLVDINDNEESEALLGSFLGAKPCSLVDLYENILVSPHQFTKEKNDSIDIDFNDFVCENKSNKDIKGDQPNTISLIFSEHELDYLESKGNETKVIDDDDDDEDLIDEVLKAKIPIYNRNRVVFPPDNDIKNKLLPDNTDSDCVMIDNIKKLEVPKLILKEIDTKKGTAGKITLDFQKVTLNTQDVKDKLNHPKITPDLLEICAPNINGIALPSPRKVIPIAYNNIPIVNHKINDVTVDPRIHLLQTVKKNEKLYRKKRIVKTDEELKNYTPGPNIYEKSLALPQIMERLANRKKIMEAKENVKRKYIIDTSSTVPQMLVPQIPVPQMSVPQIPVPQMPVPQIPVSLKPVVFAADCNKRRLAGLEARNKIENFIKYGY